MPQSDRSSIDAQAVAQFLAACRAEAHRLGGFEVELMQDPTTQAPVLIVEIADAETSIAPQIVYQVLYELADRYELPVAMVPASAVSRSAFRDAPLLQ